MALVYKATVILSGNPKRDGSALMNFAVNAAMNHLGEAAKSADERSTIMARLLLGLKTDLLKDPDVKGNFTIELHNIDNDVHYVAIRYVRDGNNRVEDGRSSGLLEHLKWETSLGLSRKFPFIERKHRLKDILFIPTK